MKIYLDYILIENIIINFIIMYQVGIFTKSKCSRKEYIQSFFIYSIYVILIQVILGDGLDNIIMRFLLVNICIYVCFKSNNLKSQLKKLIYYYLINFLYVGIIIGITIFFNISIGNIFTRIFVYIISGIIAYLFNKHLWKLWKSNIKNENLGYKLKLDDIEIECFVDTGNLVSHPIYNLDVIFIDYKWFGVLELFGKLKNKIDMNIMTINKKEIVYGYIVKNVEIYRGDKYICKLNKVIFSFSNQRINIDNKYTGLIGYNLYIDKLEGVKL